MKSEGELLRATAPVEAGADFRAEKAGGFACISPLNDRAASWLRTAVSPESSWAGEALILEMCYFADLADAVIDAGFLFEHAASSD